MGLFKSLMGVDKHEGAINAVLANHLIETCDADFARKIVKQIASIQMSMGSGMGSNEREAIEKLNTRSRITQTNFIALACNSLGIPPNIPGYVFYVVENPFRAGSNITEEHINAAYVSIRRVFGLLTPWPGDSQSIDLLRLL